MEAKFTAMKESFTPKQIRPNGNAAGLRFALVVSRFNSFITERLLSGALGALEASGAPEESIAVVRVPGSFEIPLAAKKLAEGGHADAVIAIGCVRRGETDHFDYVARGEERFPGEAPLDVAPQEIPRVRPANAVSMGNGKAGPIPHRERILGQCARSEIHARVRESALRKCGGARG